MTDYKSCSTVSLIRKIVEDSDELALKVFHETRTLFYLSGKWVRLAEFVIALKDGSIQREEGDKPAHTDMSEVSDDAYDLTIAKFRNIPSQNLKPVKADKKTPDNNRFTWNVDCRKHFKALLKEIDAALNKKAITSEIDIEETAAKVVTKFVIRHYKLSIEESKRRNTTSIRYAWEVGGRIIYLFYPSCLTAKQFRKWLEDNMKDVNPDAPDEKNRIQAIIDKKYPRVVTGQTDDPEIIEEPEMEDKPRIDQKYPGGTNVQADDPEIADKLGMEDKPPIENEEGDQFSNRLSIHVAKEKSENLEELRPAIGMLGKEGVYHLVSRIFADMANEQYNLSEVARNFNLSKATLSRFAGSDWLRDEDMEQLSKSDIPDLWINTAHVLAENPTFMETVRDTGFGSVIDDILIIVDPQKGQNHE